MDRSITEMQNHGITDDADRRTARSWAGSRDGASMRMLSEHPLLPAHESEKADAWKAELAAHVRNVVTTAHRNAEAARPALHASPVRSPDQRGSHHRPCQSRRDAAGTGWPCQLPSMRILATPTGCAGIRWLLCRGTAGGDRFEQICGHQLTASGSTRTGQSGRSNLSSKIRCRGDVRVPERAEVISSSAFS